MKRRDFVFGAPLLAAPMLGGAAPVAAPTPRWPEADEALVYLFYPRVKTGDGRTYWLLLDGRRVVKLEVDQYSFVYLTPGQHVATFRTGLELGSLHQPSEQASVTVDGGNVYYFRLASYLGPMRGWAQSNTSRPPLHFDELTPEFGRPAMRRCVYRAPEPDWPLTR